MSNVTNLRQAITGTYDRENLAELTRPVAWSGTVDEATRREQEADRAELVDDRRAGRRHPRPRRVGARARARMTRRIPPAVRSYVREIGSRRSRKEKQW